MKTGQITALTGVSKQTINNWRNNPKKRALYDIVVRGCEEVMADRSDAVRIIISGESVLVTKPNGERLEYAGQND